MRKLSLIKIKLQYQAHNRCTENNHIQVFLEDKRFYECYTILNGKQLLMFLQNTGNYTSITVRTSHLAERFSVTYNKYKNHIMLTIKPSPHIILCQIICLPYNFHGFI
jgi:hypothetical protein